MVVISPNANNSTYTDRPEGRQEHEEKEEPRWEVALTVGSAPFQTQIFDRQERWPSSSVPVDAECSSGSVGPRGSARTAH